MSHPSDPTNATQAQMQLTWDRLRLLAARATLSGPSAIARDDQRRAQLHDWLGDAGIDFTNPMVRQAIARVLDALLINVYLERGGVPDDEVFTSDLLLNLLAGMAVSTLPSGVEV